MQPLRTVDQNKPILFITHQVSGTVLLATETDLYPAAMGEPGQLAPARVPGTWCCELFLVFQAQKDPT
jgi:hypothetical protein